MANIKISQLPVASTPLDGTEVFPLVQGSTTKKITASNLTQDILEPGVIVRSLESLGARASAAATVNDQAINTALSQGGLWSLLTPGIYAVTADNFSPSATSAIVLGLGVSFSIGGTALPLVSLLDVVTYAPTDGAVAYTGGEINAKATDTSAIVKASGPTTLTVTVPATGAGRIAVCNGDGLSDTSVSVRHLQSAIRMGNSGSSIVLPTINAYATSNLGWTLGMLVRIQTANTQSGTTHLRFAQVGTGSAYLLFGYEGLNATNPFAIKFLMPNAAGTGLVSVRLGANSTFSPFHTNRLGEWAWIFARKHDAALTESYLQLSNGTQATATFADETITLAWAPVQLTEPANTVVYAGTVNIASGNFSAANAALTIGPDASNTGTFDIAKVFFLSQTVSIANLGRLATGKRPQDIGLTVDNSTDVYYDFTSTTAANLIDLCGGTAATSVTLAGTDARTPSSAWPLVTQYLGDTGGGLVDVVFADQQARALP